MIASTLTIEEGSTVWYEGEKFWVLQIGEAGSIDENAIETRVQIVRIYPIERAISPGRSFSFFVKLEDCSLSLMNDFCFSSEWVLGVFNGTL